MSGSIRYFKNTFPAFTGDQNYQVPRKAIQEQICQIKNKLLQEYRLEQRCCAGGLYLGVAGVAFALTRLLALPPHNSDKKLLEFTASCIQMSIEYENMNQKHEVKPALLLGTGGVLIAAALFQKQVGNVQSETVSQLLKSYGDLKKICNPPFQYQDYLRCGSDEVLLGRAGYLCGVHTIGKEFSEQVLDEQSINEICMTIVEVGRQTAKKLSSASPLMYQYHNTQSLGAAHGLSGILFALLNFPAFIKSDASVERDVKAAVDYFLAIQAEDGNFATVVGEERSGRAGEGLVHWCHGAPGVIYLLAKAYLLWGEEKYLNACIRCADLCWEYGLLLKGPGICHGVAGNGYVFLLMYRLTKQVQYLYKAVQFAQFLESEEFKSKARTPDSPFSLFEGLAGTLCFLIHLLNPDQAEFPFFEVY
ncbi:putative lanC-like protein 3-like isoform X5 [Apostichopus japonicus]|uniref:Putative lanC-like protein 3-like isoform X5 n=1 Tax=Stichopus japonicus TaxID=307972 RepID=A0A2G8KCL1_STIJA|nr:putative lanC-like protein 3-like isoform X5 [Apostichopus japonicus]